MVVGVADGRVGLFCGAVGGFFFFFPVVVVMVVVVVRAVDVFFW